MLMGVDIGVALKMRKQYCLKLTNPTAPSPARGDPSVYHVIITANSSAVELLGLKRASTIEVIGGPSNSSVD